MWLTWGVSISALHLPVLPLLGVMVGIRDRAVLDGCGAIGSCGVMLRDRGVVLWDRMVGSEQEA